MRDRVTVCECGAQLHGTTANDMEYHLRSRRHATNMRLVGLQGSLVIRVTENFAEYRHCIEHCVAAEDTVVEMGCGRGVTTDLLARRCSRAVGIDASAKVIEMARSRFPHVTFATGAAEDISGIRALGDFSVLFLDINGSRELATLRCAPCPRPSPSHAPTHAMPRAATHSHHAQTRQRATSLGLKAARARASHRLELEERHAHEQQRGLRELRAQHEVHVAIQGTLIAGLIAGLRRPCV